MSNSAPKPLLLAPHQLWRGAPETAQSDPFGGALLLGATVLALVLANTPAADAYTAVRDFTFGPEALHFDLSIGTWAADGLLAIFFFVVGLELKEEFVAGKLRNPKQAALPIAAAAGGVIVPALIFAGIALTSDSEGAMRGWAIPTATDIAFAVAVLAVVGRFLPPALRVFLLTLAIVDDLIAITIIAVVYTEGLQIQWLLLALVPLLAFAVLVQRGTITWWLIGPLAFLTWALVHASGIHATVAGVVLGFTVPVIATERAKIQTSTERGEPVYDGVAAYLADQWGVLSTLLAVPVFAFFSAGVTVGGLDGMRSAIEDPITLGIIAGLFVGKPIGIVTTTFLLSRLPAFQMDESLRWPDMIGMGFIAGVGFTVSLLVGELAYGSASVADEHVKIGVLLGSLVSALAGGVILSIRSHQGRQREPVDTRY